MFHCKYISMYSFAEFLHKMSICLINPPQMELREPTAYMPLGLAYVAAKHPDSTIVNWANGIVEEDLPNAEYFGITCQKATTVSTKEVIAVIRKRRPFSTIIVGGAVPSANPDIAKTLGADKLFSGIYADIRDYFPDRSKFSKECVINLTGVHNSSKPSTHVIASTGCTGKCSFCEKGHSMYRKFIYREPNHIIEELLQLKSEYGIEHVRFTDECFTLSKKVVLSLCKELEKIDITYVCITRTDKVDHDILEALYQSGCTHIFYGIESGSQRILDAMNKGTTVQQNLEAIRNTKDHGIKVKTLFIYKYPGETDNDRDLTVQFVKESQPDLFVLSQWTNEDFFYPDNDLGWTQFKDRLTQCINH